MALVALAAAVHAQNNVTSLFGTWTSGSGAVVTGAVSPHAARHAGANSRRVVTAEQQRSRHRRRFDGCRRVLVRRPIATPRSTIPRLARRTRPPDVDGKGRMFICGHTDFGTCVPARLGGEGQDVGNPEPLLSPASHGPFQHSEDTDAAMADKASLHRLGKPALTLPRPPRRRALPTR